MAFLSLGLNIDEPQSIEQIAAVCPESDLSDNILCDSGPELDPASAQESQVLVPVAKSPQNGANGSTAKNVSKPTDDKKDEWPEMGMQIIQQVLRDTQSKTALAAAESSEQISGLPPTIEELRKKILESIIPDFRVAPKNGHQQTHASLTPDSPSEPKSEVEPSNKFGDSTAATAPELLFSIIDELRKHIHSSTRTTNRNTVGDQEIDCVLNRSALPVIDVVRLVAARDPQRLRVANRAYDKRIARRCSVGYD